MDARVYAPPVSSDPRPDSPTTTSDRSTSEESCPIVQNARLSLQGQLQRPLQQSQTELRYDHFIPPPHRLDFTKNVNPYSSGVFMGRIHKHARELHTPLFPLSHFGQIVDDLQQIHPAVSIEATTTANSHTPGASHSNRFWQSVLCQDASGVPIFGPMHDLPQLSPEILAPSVNFVPYPVMSAGSASSSGASLSSPPPSREELLTIRPGRSTGRSTRATMRVADQRERPFACDRCPSRFTIKAHLKQHIRYVHDKIRPHACWYEGCTVRFGTQFARNQVSYHCTYATADARMATDTCAAYVDSA